MTNCKTCTGSVQATHDGTGFQLTPAYLRFRSDDTHQHNHGEARKCPECGKLWMFKHYKRYQYLCNECRTTSTYYAEDMIGKFHTYAHCKKCSKPVMIGRFDKEA